jgi:hypothetical protein
MCEKKIAEAIACHLSGKQYVFQNKMGITEDEAKKECEEFATIWHAVLQAELKRGGLRIITTPAGGQRYEKTASFRNLPVQSIDSAFVPNPDEGAIRQRVKLARAQKLAETPGDSDTATTPGAPDEEAEEAEVKKLMAEEWESVNKANNDIYLMYRGGKASISV